MMYIYIWLFTRIGDKSVRCTHGFIRMFLFHGTRILGPGGDGSYTHTTIQPLRPAGGANNKSDHVVFNDPQCWGEGALELDKIAIAGIPRETRVTLLITLLT